MKILIATPLYPPESGGPATYTALLERELQLRGFQVAVAKLSDVRKWPFGIRHLFFFFKLLWAGVLAGVVFAQDPLGVGFPALCAAKILGKKFVVKIVGDRAWEEYMNQGNAFVYPEDFPRTSVHLGIWLRQCTQIFVARHADKIIVPSEYLKKLIVNGWGISPQSIEVIYNAFDAPDMKITRDEARKKLHISSEEGVVVSIGRLVPWKGFGTLIKMFPEILKKYPHTKLFIIGEGPERKNLLSSIKNLDLKKSVFLTGNVPHDDTLLYLIAADVVVLNTGYEGLSHVILEAMALGVPVITTRIGGNPELIEDGVSGRLVAYQDKEALTKATTEILDDSTLARKRFEESAQKKASAFSKERMLTHLAQFFEKL